MRALLTHSKRYKVTITGLATRPDSIKPEPVTETEQSSEKCVVVFVCIEAKDTPELAKQLGREVELMMQDVGDKKVVLVPFAHLSSNLASSELAIEVLNALQNALASHNPLRSHFGSDKAFSIDFLGHPGNIRFREFKP
ncbi:MAG TPA: threonyl-tRNA synthetase editing domain-containing protein [Candidatus Paceibacterota bacterium]